MLTPHCQLFLAFRTSCACVNFGVLSGLPRAPDTVVPSINTDRAFHQHRSYLPHTYMPALHSLCIDYRSCLPYILRLNVPSFAVRSCLPCVLERDVPVFCEHLGPAFPRQQYVPSLQSQVNHAFFAYQYRLCLPSVFGRAFFNY